MSDKNHVEDAVLAAYDRYAQSVSEVTADRCALAFREGFLAGHAEAETELRAENEQLKSERTQYPFNVAVAARAELRECQAENERLAKIFHDTLEIDQAEIERLKAQLESHAW